MNLKQFQALFPKFGDSLKEAFKGIDPFARVSIMDHKGSAFKATLPNVWRVYIDADLTGEYYLVWLDGITEEPCWFREGGVDTYA